MSNSEVIRDGTIKISDLHVGMRIGRLVLRRKVREPASPGKPVRTFWYCDCSCGKKDCRVEAGNFARSVPTQSCKCLQRECISARSRTHGERGYGDRKVTSEYETWCHIISRCTNRNSKDYFRYGGRGIKVCKRWEKYENFLSDMGRRPSPRHEIDRRNNDGNYEPGNCRWVTKKEQARNRRSNVVIEVDGIKRIAIEWSEFSGVPAQLIIKRFRKGWSAYDAVYGEVRKCKRRITT